MAHGEPVRDVEIRTVFAQHAWETTPLGAPEGWPAALATAWSICLHSRFPMILFWGDELIQLYNAAFVPILGKKHPAAMGMRAADCWHEIWDQIGPMLRSGLERGDATFSEDFRLLIERGGAGFEECYFTFSYSPVPGEGGHIDGVFCVVTETTRIVQGRRRMQTLHDLEHVVRDASDGRDAVAAAVRLLAASADATAARAEIIDPTLDETIVAAAGDDDARLVIDEPLADEAGTVGRLRLAPNPVCPLDDDYRSFFRLAANQLGAGLARVFAREHERRRARELEELDRAKTTFFSSVSHEFRTPLTLMLGPLDDLVRTLPDFEQRRNAELARRNAIRLRKLVNTLLDFAHVESGRHEMQVAAIELDELIGDIASEFRSAFAAVGLTLDVHANRPGPVRVDRAMFEKIVMNLLANALKFTAAGGVRVETTESHGQYVLRVSDTGVGIAPEDLTRVFERFRRSAATTARSHEGSGIGLALVRELTRMHGGEITVESTVGAGSTFTVRLPLERPNVPSAPTTETGASTRAAREEFLEEAAALARGAGEQQTADDDPARIVFADDNADLRAYVTRLLGARYRVEAVRDGVELLAAVERARPALVIADVMMPRMDGIGALRALRADPRTADLPFLLLSARAGDEAVAAGLSDGADDYIVKPFVASELLARVAALVRVRRHDSTPAAAGDGAHRRESALLAAVADRFIAAVDTGAVAQAVTDVLAGTFADWCVVFVPKEDGRLEAASVGHAEPAKAELGRMIERQYPRRLGDGSPPARAIASGMPVLVTRIEPVAATELAVAPGHAELIAALGIRSVAAVPVMSGGRAVAAIVAACCDAQRILGEADLHVLQRFADRTALALENARLYERERTIAATLQRALLPGTLPVVDGLHFFASYSPASEESLIGGDWYDAFRAADGRIVISIGDVVGHGLAAATVMATLRQAIRGFAVEDVRPGAILEHLNRVLLAEGNERLATALVASIDPQTLDLRIASAGHYGPALVPSGGGEPLYLDTPGILLGADDAPTFAEHAHQLTPGDTLAFFTDGFIENERDAIAGGERFTAAVRSASSSSDPATAIHHAVFGGSASRDDAALLVVQPQPVLESLAFSIPGDPQSAASARIAIGRFLNGLGFDADRTIEILTAAGEAIINAIEHGYRSERGIVRVTGTVLTSGIEIEVQDFGGWREAAGPNAHRGFGLPLMHAFADAVDVERTPFGTRVLMRFGREAPSTARASV